MRSATEGRTSALTILPRSSSNEIWDHDHLIPLTVLSTRSSCFDNKIPFSLHIEHYPCCPASSIRANLPCMIILSVGTGAFCPFVSQLAFHGRRAGAPGPPTSTDGPLSAQPSRTGLHERHPIPLLIVCSLATLPYKNHDTLAVAAAS